MPGRLPLLSALAAALLVAAPAMGQQQSPAQGQHLALPAPSDPDWPPDGTPPSLDSEQSAWSGREPAFDCGRELPCRLRLRGVLGGNNGGIAVEGTAFTW